MPLHEYQENYCHVSAFNLCINSHDQLTQVSTYLQPGFDKEQLISSKDANQFLKLFLTVAYLSYREIWKIPHSFSCDCVSQSLCKIHFLKFHMLLAKMRYLNLKICRFPSKMSTKENGRPSLYAKFSRMLHESIIITGFTTILL